MATLTFEPHYKYIIELSCTQHNDTDVSKITPAQIFESALIRIPKNSKPQKYGAPLHYITANVPSGMIGQYYNVAQKYVIDTYLEKSQFEETCDRISNTHRNCKVKILKDYL